jgi:hypothetical protein
MPRRASASAAPSPRLIPLAGCHRRPRSPGSGAAASVFARIPPSRAIPVIDTVRTCKIGRYSWAFPKARPTANQRTLPPRKDARVERRAPAFSGGRGDNDEETRINRLGGERIVSVAGPSPCRPLPPLEYITRSMRGRAATAGPIDEPIVTAVSRRMKSADGSATGVFVAGRDQKISGRLKCGPVLPIGESDVSVSPHWCSPRRISL